MATDIGIANAALRRLGANTITSFTQGTKSANCANDLYVEARDELLRSHYWNFAQRRVKLAQLSKVPSFGFDFAYALPSDWIRTVSVFDNDAGVGTVEYSEEYQDGQNVLLSSATDIYLVYTARVTDPNRMPPDFRRALSRSLAEAMAVDLTGSNTLQQACAEEAKEFARKARSADAQGSTPRGRPRGSWATSRGGFRSRWDDTFGND
jgi:hypothetical protein